MMNHEKSHIRVSVSEAARLLGLSSKSIRDAIRKQEIRYIVVRNRYKISFESLLLWSQRTAKRANKLARSGLGQYVDNWKISVTKFSPRPPQKNP